MKHRPRPALAAWAATIVAMPASAAEPPAGALIVKLSATPEAHALQRWRQLLESAGLSGLSGRREPTLRAVGRSAQRLDFGRRLSADESRQLVARLRQRAEVAWVEPDTREQALQVPSDPLYAQQWWLRAAGGSNGNVLADRLRGVPGFLRAWQSGIPGSTGGAAAVVAVLDTGITPHPELAGRMLPGYDFVAEAVYGNDGNGRDADPTDPGDWVSTQELGLAAFDGCQATDSTWHGTIIAGIVAAATDNGQGVAGINRNGRVLPVRVAGKCGAALSDIVDGMRWAAGLPVAGVPANPNPARIVNISFGGSAACGPAYQEAIDELRAIGVVVVAAAGNGFSTQASRPASCERVVGVVALNRDGFKTNYSNFGASFAASGIATVGGDDADGRWGSIFSDGGLAGIDNDGRREPGQAGYGARYGTSFATPLVSGTVSLMLSVNPALSWEQIVLGLRTSSRPHVTSPRIAACSDSNAGRCICGTATCGAGILDAEQALRFAAHPGSYVAPARQPEAIDNPDVVQAVALGPDRGAPPGTPDGSGGASALGGGAFGSAAWLLGLAAAVAALRRRAPTAP